MKLSASHILDVAQMMKFVLKGWKTFSLKERECWFPALLHVPCATSSNALFFRVIKTLACLPKGKQFTSLERNTNTFEKAVGQY